VENKENIFYKNPWDFMSWCKRNKVKNTIPKDGVDNNNNLVQSLDDVVQTKEMNCVDASIIVHDICTNDNTIANPRIVLMKWYRSPSSMPGHLLTMFTKKSTNKIYAFNWLGNLSSKIEGPYEDDIDLIEDVGKTLGKSAFPRSKLLFYIFTDDDIEYVYEVKDNITQRELLDHVKEHADFINLGSVFEMSNVKE